MVPVAVAGRADAKRRSLLSRAMENPKLLVLAKSKGRPCTFDAKCATLIDGGNAAQITNQGLKAVISVKPKPKDKMLELGVIVDKNKETFLVPFAAIRASVMGIDPSKAANNNDGVVSITFVIRTKEGSQLLSVVPRISDQCRCRMLVNLPGLKKQFVDSAFVSGTPTDRSKLVSAVYDAYGAGADVSSSFAESLGQGWQALSPREAMQEAIPGIVRIAGVVGALSARKKSELLQNPSAPPNHCFVRISAAAVVDQVNDQGQRIVQAYIEHADQIATYRQDGKEHLLAKWKGLNVCMEPYEDDDGSLEKEIRGSIVDFRWYTGNDPPVYVAVIECDDKSIEDIGIQELEVIVPAAEQPDGMILAPGEFAELEKLDGDEPGDSPGEEEEDEEEAAAAAEDSAGSASGASAQPSPKSAAKSLLLAAAVLARNGQRQPRARRRVPFCRRRPRLRSRARRNLHEEVPNARAMRLSSRRSRSVDRRGQDRDSTRALQHAAGAS